MVNLKIYPNLRQEWNVEIFVFPGRLYSKWQERDGRGGLVRIGIMDFEASDFGALFMWETIGAFLEEAGLDTLELLGLRQEVRGYGHLVTRGGPLGGGALYGISLKENSRIYAAELDLRGLFPQWH